MVLPQTSPNYTSSMQSLKSYLRSLFAITDCSKDYTGDNGRVTSPGYPLYYHDIHDCKITITAPSGTFLALYFTEFNVEFSTDCVYDKLDVSDV